MYVCVCSHCNYNPSHPAIVEGRHSYKYVDNYLNCLYGFVLTPVTIRRCKKVGKSTRIRKLTFMQRIQLLHNNKFFKM